MRRHCSATMNSLASFLLLLLLASTSSRTHVVVEAVGTPPAHVSGGGATEGAATAAAAGSSIAIDAVQPVFDVDDALAAIRAQAAAGSGSAPLSPAAAATAGRTAMDKNACGPGLGRCTLAMGGCCSERGTCGWACRGACQGPFSAPGFCETGTVGTSGTSVSAALPPAASSLPLASLGSPCGAYLARCAGGGARKGEGAGSCCSVLGFCVRAPSPLCSGGGSEDDDDSFRRRTTRRFRLVATRGETNTSVEGSSGLHFHGVRWGDRANEDGAAGVAQRAVAAGGAEEEGREGRGGSGGDGGRGSSGGGGSLLLPPVPPSSSTTSSPATPGRIGGTRT